VRSIVVALIALVACSKGEDGKPKPKRVMQFPVEVQPVASRAVEYAITAVGSIDVFEKVQITARVPGVVEKVSFREGDVVKQGANLAAIDPARFSLAARQAAATIDSARAALADAEAGLARREQADKTNPGLIPGEEIRTWQTKVATAKADLAARHVARDQAALDLKYAYVRAPIAGEIQTRTIETGQYVAVGAVLATMVRREPLLLRFKVAETEAPRFAKAAQIAFTVEGGGRPYRAVVSYIAAVAEPTSRMVDVTAEIDDPDRGTLRPGGFAQVSVPVGATKDAPVVPESSVRPSEKGFLAFVVEGDVAKERVVELGLRTADGLVEIKKGLAIGEQVVVRGAEALRDGAPVKVGGGPPGKGGGGSGSRRGSGSAADTAGSSSGSAGTRSPP
jgi:membrane fusion protein (multidrug efflux system)/multidrug efflux system membrane fusion protein